MPRCLAAFAFLLLIAGGPLRAAAVAVRLGVGAIYDDVQPDHPYRLNVRTDFGRRLQI